MSLRLFGKAVFRTGQWSGQVLGVIQEMDKNGSIMINSVLMLMDDSPLTQGPRRCRVQHSDADATGGISKLVWPTGLGICFLLCSFWKVKSGRALVKLLYCPSLIFRLTTCDENRLELMTPFILWLLCLGIFQSFPSVCTDTYCHRQIVLQNILESSSAISMLAASLAISQRRDSACNILQCEAL